MLKTTIHVEISYKKLEWNYSLQFLLIKVFHNFLFKLTNIEKHVKIKASVTILCKPQNSFTNYDDVQAMDVQVYKNTMSEIFQNCQ